MNPRGARFQFGATTVLLGVGNLINLVTAIVLARQVDDAVFGRVMYAFAFSAIVSLVAKAGLDQAVIYFYPRYASSPAQRRGLFWTALVTAVVMSATLGLAFWGLREALDGGLAMRGFEEDAAWIAALGVGLSVINVVGAAINAAHHSVARAVIVYLVFPAVFLGWVVGGPSDVTADFLAGRTLALGCALVLCAAALRRYTGSECLSLATRDSSDRREWFRYAAPSLLAGVVLYLVEHVDVLILGGMSTADEVGLYSVAARCVLPLLLLRTAYSMVMDPRVARLHHDGTLVARRQDLLRGSRWLARLVALLVGLTVVGRDLIPLVFGAEYQEATVVVVWLAIGYGLAAWLGVCATMLNMTGAPRLELVNGIATLALNAVLCAVLVRRYGAEGAAIASAISLGVLGAVRVVQVRRHLGWVPLSLRDLRPLGLVGAVHAALRIVDQSPAAEAVAGAALVVFVVGVDIIAARGPG